ncbi:hypothetical protein ACFQZC_17760 [Streptacidiphilus monticola]
MSASSDGRLRIASTCVMVGATQAELSAQIRRLTVRPASVGLHSASFFHTMQVMGGVAGESVSQAHVRGPCPGRRRTAWWGGPPTARGPTSTPAR